MLSTTRRALHKKGLAENGEGFGKRETGDKLLMQEVKTTRKWRSSRSLLRPFHFLGLDIDEFLSEPYSWGRLVRHSRGHHGEIFDE